MSGPAAAATIGGFPAAQGDFRAVTEGGTLVGRAAFVRMDGTTYDNECQLENAGVVKAYAGKCLGD